MHFLPDPDFFSKFNVFAVNVFLSALLVYELGKVLVDKFRRPPR